MTAQHHHFECAHDQVRPGRVRDYARDAVVEEALDGFRRGFVDQHRGRRRRAGAAERLKFAEPADVQPVDRNEVETLGAQQSARLETVGRIVDAGMTVDLP